MVQVKVVEDGVAAKRAIEQLFIQGFTKNDVYVLAHDKDRSKHLTEALELKKIEVKEKGVLDLTANVLQTREEELRSKMESLGLSDSEAKQYEKELDLGSVIVVAAK
jgi:hypothetical protein